MTPLTYVDPTPYFAACIIMGFLIGWFAKRFLADRLIRRAKADGYHQARLFFERKAEPNARRI